MNDLLVYFINITIARKKKRGGEKKTRDCIPNNRNDMSEQIK